LRWQPVLAPQIVWTRSTRRAEARGTARDGRGQLAEDLDDHRRIFDACPEGIEGAAMIFKAQFGQSEIVY
jgi:hypothetical protein